MLQVAKLLAVLSDLVAYIRKHSKLHSTYIYFYKDSVNMECRVLYSVASSNG